MQDTASKRLHMIQKMVLRPLTCKQPTWIQWVENCELGEKREGGTGELHRRKEVMGVIRAYMLV